MKSKIKAPRILFFDIETKPVKFWGWRTGDQVVRHDQIVAGEKFDIICIAWKFLGSPTIRCVPWDARQDSGEMLNEFAAAIAQADVIVGQNIDSFDIKQVNLQRLLHKQPAIQWPPTEDVKKLVSKNFYVVSRSLKYMSKLLGGTGKDRMEFQDWIDIVDGHSAKALTKMVKYCKRDVLETEYVWKAICKHCPPPLSVKRVYQRLAMPLCPRCHERSNASKGFGRRYCACGHHFSVTKK